MTHGYRHVNKYYVPTRMKTFLQMKNVYIRIYFLYIFKYLGQSELRV